MVHLRARHLNFIFITGYLASYCYLLVVSRLIYHFDQETEWAYLWSSPGIALLIFLMLAILYLPLGIIFAGLLLLCQRMRYFPIPYLLAAVSAAILVWFTNHALTFGLIVMPNRVLDPKHTVDLLPCIALTIVGWAAMIIYAKRQPSAARLRLERETEQYIEHASEQHVARRSEETVP